MTEEKYRFMRSPQGKTLFMGEEMAKSCEANQGFINEPDVLRAKACLGHIDDHYLYAMGLQRNQMEWLGEKLNPTAPTYIHKPHAPVPTHPDTAGNAPKPPAPTPTPAPAVHPNTPATQAQQQPKRRHVETILEDILIELRRLANK